MHYRRYDCAPKARPLIERHRHRIIGKAGINVTERKRNHAELRVFSREALPNWIKGCDGRIKHTPLFCVMVPALLAPETASPTNVRNTVAVELFMITSLMLNERRPQDFVRFAALRSPLERYATNDPPASRLVATVVRDGHSKNRAKYLVMLSILLIIINIILEQRELVL